MLEVTTPVPAAKHRKTMNTRNATAQLFAAITLLGAPCLYAQSNWIPATGGNWDTPTNWSTDPTIPNAIDADARITNLQTAGAYTINASSAQTFTVGRLDFGSNLAAVDLDMTLGSNVGLIFDVTSGNAQLNLATGATGSTMVIQSAIQLNDNLTLTSARNGSSQISAQFTGAVNLQGNTWTINNSVQGLRIDGLVSGTGGALVIANDSGSQRTTQITNTASTFTGGVSIGRANTVQLGNLATYTGTGGGGVLGTGTITVAANSTTNDGNAATIESNGAFVSNDFTDTTTNILANTINIASGRVLRINTGRPMNFGDAAGDLTGSGRLVKVGGNSGGMRQLALNHANTGFTGTVEIQDGQVQTRVTDALGTGSTIQFNAQNNTNGVGLQGSMASGTDVSIGSTLDFVKNGNSHFIGTSGGSTFTLTGNFSNSGAGAAGYIGFGRGNQNNSVGNGGFATGTNTGTATIRLTGTGSLENNIGIVDGSGTQSVLSLGNTSGTQTFSGLVSGNGDLVRNGSGGTSILSGATNSYSGTTTVTAGTLLVNGGHTGGGAYTVNGGNLGGTGSIGSATSISSGSLVAGGIGATGNLTFTNGLTFTGGSVAWEINANSVASGFDKITVSGGNVTLGSAVASFDISALGGVNFADSFWASDRSWTVIDNTGAGTITGTFLLTGTTTNAFGSFNLAHGSGVGGDVILNWTATAIPEPSTFAALAGLGALGLAASRRRRAA